MSDWWKPTAAARRLGGGGSDGDYTYNPNDWGGGGSDRDALGVPEGYVVPRVRTGQYSERGAQTAAAMGRTPGTIKDQGPRYFDGDEFTPAALSPAAIGRLQAALSNAGLLSDFRYGVWDQDSRTAYKALLEEANAAGLTAEVMLTRRQQGMDVNVGGGGGSGSGGGGGRQIVGFDEEGNPIYSEFQAPPLELRLSNKDDLRRVFRTAVIDKIGEGWSQAQIDELVDAYNWQEIRVQQEAYQSEVDRMRAEFEGAPSTEPIVNVAMESPETFLDEEVRRRDPAGVQATDIAEDYAPAFFQALGGYV